MRLDALLPIEASAEQKYRPDTHDLEGKTGKYQEWWCGLFAYEPPFSASSLPFR